MGEKVGWGAREIVEEKMRGDGLRIGERESQKQRPHWGLSVLLPFLSH